MNNPDPNTPGNTIFYRDVTLLPKGVGVGLNNNTYTYNLQQPMGRYHPELIIPPLDRYLRLGAIMFNPDGTLTTIPFGIPLTEQFTLSLARQHLPKPPVPEVGMYSQPDRLDMGSNVTPNPGNVAAICP